MAKMIERSERAERLVVAMETSHGSGEFQVDPRLRADEVWQRSDETMSRAVIGVLLTDACDSEEVRRLYHPDRRLLVTTEHADLQQREILFEGYPPVQVSRWDGSKGREGEQYVFEAEHVWARYNRAREAWIYGRRMRSGAIEDGLITDPAAYASRSTLISALPCIFNPDGVANRAAEPLIVTAADGSPRRIHIFSHDEDARAVRWTYATALRYLVWFHLGRSGPVFEGNIFDMTESLAADQPGEAGPLRSALAREPVSLTCEATTLVEALALWSEAAGLHVTAETVNAQGRPRTQLRVWSPRAGACRTLHLVRGGRFDDGVPRYDAASRDAAQVLRDNNTYRGEVAWDHRPIVNQAVVLGDVKRYELTLPLWPGWVPVADLDNVPAEDRAAARMLALTPDMVTALGEQAAAHTWYRRYHRAGSEYEQYSDVARLWVLNEDGCFTGTAYNRNPPFDNYQPFDFSTVLAAGETRRGAWTRRVRPLAPALSLDSDGRSLGVYVEVSFDGGSTWVRPNGPISVLKDRAGIHFDADNPTQITPPGVSPVVNNLWYALVDQVFRVRVTAVVESDERLMACFGPDGLISPTVLLNSQVLRRPQSLKFASRALGSSVFRDVPAISADTRDDSVVAADLARWLAQNRQDRQVQVAPAIPWIETGYAIGDRITGIAGRQVSFATTQGTEIQYPSVLERRFVLRDGRYETVLTLQAADVPEGVL
ncbi:MAG TPA: hypothetical protein PLS23_10815 [Phycisphaerae bacterium]|nr:hypothetical protein [Phycisphaerae bacterium]